MYEYNLRHLIVPILIINQQNRWLWTFFKSRWFAMRCPLLLQLFVRFALLVRAVWGPSHWAGGGGRTILVDVSWSMRIAVAGGLGVLPQENFEIYNAVDAIYRCSAIIGHIGHCFKSCILHKSLRSTFVSAALVLSMFTGVKQQLLCHYEIILRPWD